MIRAVKREPMPTRSGRTSTSSSTRVGNAQNHNGNQSAAKAGNMNSTSSNNSSNDSREDFVERRVLRSRYLNVKNRISDERDDISRVDSDVFKSIIQEVDNLHELVQKPREQVADAEALLDITNTLATSVKAHSSDGLTPTDFVSCLLRDFASQGGQSTSTDVGSNSIRWKDIGLEVSHVLRSAPGCSTMVGPMNTEIKQRKPAVHRKRARPTESARPEDLDDVEAEEQTDTDKNMATMFEILRRNRRVGLENLILNRKSFAQTVENLFALSFLVKDGRAEITVDAKGAHLVSPRNAASAAAVHSGEVSYGHFVFRFDFRDWKLMMTCFGEGEELMPHREMVNLESISQPDLVFQETQAALSTTPIRKLSRNRGLVLQEQTIVQDSPESDDLAARAAAIRKGKRKII